MEEFTEHNLSEESPKHTYRLIKPNAPNRENQPDDGYERRLLADFMEDKQKREENLPPAQSFYYGAIRATALCRNCHPRGAEEKELYPELAEQDLMEAMRGVGHGALLEGPARRRAADR